MHKFLYGLFNWRCVGSDTG